MIIIFKHVYIVSLVKASLLTDWYRCIYTFNMLVVNQVFFLCFIFLQIELEFGGAGGVVFNMIMMTVSVFLVNAACNKVGYVNSIYHITTTLHATYFNRDNRYCPVTIHWHTHVYNKVNGIKFYD